MDGNETEAGIEMQTQEEYRTVLIVPKEKLLLVIDDTLMTARDLAEKWLPG